MVYHNPIVPGFHPDPTVCRVGEDYYLATSSFEYFPGIPLFHSRDLVHWEPLGHALTRPGQVKLSRQSPNGLGIFAPTLRHHNGRFYLTTTNVGDPEGHSGNFVIWTDDIRGEWSDPVWIDLPGIDPSLYFEGDRVYYTGTSGGIFLAEIDLQTGAILAPPRPLWAGTGGADPEGPHLYRIDDTYYLVISEGGTSQGHMLTVARSPSLEGPYEPCPHNPVLTNRSLPLPVRAAGHADLFQAHDGTWWAVCLGIRVVGYPDRHLLGRETFLVPVTWNQGWPIFGQGSVQLRVETACLPSVPVRRPPVRDDFDSSTLGFEWNFIGVPDPTTWSLDAHPGSLTLWGSGSGWSDQEPIAWVGRRQQHLGFTAQTRLSFDPQAEGESAGLSLYLNNQHHYELSLTRRNGASVVEFRRQIGTLWKVERQVPWGTEVEIEVTGDTEWYRFRCRAPGGDWVALGQGEVQYLATEVGGRFTGAFIALFAASAGHRSLVPARFDWFDYLPQGN